MTLTESPTRNSCSCSISPNRDFPLISKTPDEATAAGINEKTTGHAVKTVRRINNEFPDASASHRPTGHMTKAGGKINGSK
jgi:hypothetical protein